MLTLFVDEMVVEMAIQLVLVQPPSYAALKSPCALFNRYKNIPLNQNPALSSIELWPQLQI